MYAKAGELDWGNPAQPRRQKRNLLMEKWHNNSSTVIDSDAIVSQFWQLWQEMRDRLYHCCLKLMNYNSTDAEDALSQAMLKAREKVLKYAGKIRNWKAWLMQVTRNLCIDLIGKRSKEAAGIDRLGWVEEAENGVTTNAVDTPETVLESEEKVIAIREAIASLPERLRHTFILHFYRQLSHREIASEQGISYENVCKQICLARKHLKQQLSSYFRGTDEDVKGIREQGERTKEITEAIEVQKKPVLEIQTVWDDLESVETIEAEIPESVAGCLEHTVVANQEILETGIVAVDRVSVEAEKMEPVGGSVLPGVRVVREISKDARVSGENQLLSFAPGELAQLSFGEKVVSWLRKFASLPEPLHDTFSLHFYRQLSHKEMPRNKGYPTRILASG